MLPVQKFLLTKTFGDLEIEHGVYATFSNSGHMFSLNYDQIEARESDPLSQNCRGLVLSAVDGKSFTDQAVETKGRLNYSGICPGETVIQAFPMSRFFNYGQGAAAVNLNQKDITAYSKLDGTLTILFKDKFSNEYNIATRSVPQADIKLDASDLTFRTLFEKSLYDSTGMSFNDLCQICDSDYTYCFELTGFYNRIVVKYEKCEVTLLAVRNNNTLLESKIEECPLVTKHNFKIPNTYKINESPEQLINWVNEQHPFEQEGVVICDSKFNRLKIKSAAYVAFNRVHDLRLGTSDRNCLEIILLEKEDDICPMLPTEIANKLIGIKTKLVDFIHKHDAAYCDAAKQALDAGENDKLRRKHFASLVTVNSDVWSAPLFYIYNGKASNIKEFIFANKKEGTWSHSFLDQILSKLGK